MRPVSLLLLVLGCATPRPTVTLAPVPPASLPRPERLAAAAALLEPELAARFEKSKAPGMVVGLVVDGRLAWLKGYGVRDVKTQAPVDANTVFRLASLTKAFTAAAALQLRDEGRLELDAPVERYLPELKSLTPATADAPKVTLRLLLSHSAGLPEDNASGDLRIPLSDLALDEAVAKGLSFSTAPGTHFEYANLGFALVGRVLARVAAEPYQTLVTRLLLAPLGMTDTRFEGTDVPDDRRAHGYGRRDSPMPSSGLTHWEDDLPHEEPALADGSGAAMGGLWTTASDYARWVAFQLAAWPPRDGPELGPVRRASIRETQSVQRFAGLYASRPEGRLQASAGGYGFGWGVRQSCDFEAVVAHNGGLPGYGSTVRLLPGAGVGVFVMTNLTYQGGNSVASALLEGLAKMGLLEAPPAQPSPTLTRGFDAILGLLRGWDEAAFRAAVDPTFLVYRPPAVVKAQLEKLTAGLGRCGPPARFEVENRLRGLAVVPCDKGSLTVKLELTADAAPVAQTVDLVAHPRAGPRFVGPLAQVSDALALAVEGLARRHGSCQITDAWPAEEGKDVEVHLGCDRGEVKVQATLDAANKVTSARVQEPGERCQDAP